MASAAAAITIPLVGWFISPIIGKVIERGDSLLKERQKLERGAKEEIRRLGVVLKLIRGVVDDAEEKQSKNQAVHAWLGELKQVLYDAEDLLDQHEAHITLKHQQQKQKGDMAKVPSLAATSSTSKFNLQMRQAASGSAGNVGVAASEAGEI